MDPLVNVQLTIDKAHTSPQRAWTMNQAQVG